MQEGTRVLAVALSNEVFDKLDDFVKEAQVTKKQYVADLIEKDLEQKLQQKQEPAKQIEVRQAPDGQQIWGRAEVINALDKFMIENGRIVIIDFDRYDFGDPWEEFNRIVWCAQSAPLFASGIVNGYFDNEVPMDFWELLALYISSNMLSSIPWAIPFGDGEIQTMLNQAKDVLEWYDNMQNPVPKWYIKGE